MTISANDIVYVLSGGGDNADPNKSLGGNPSSHFILGTTNNLFDDVTEDEAAAGRTDYRCFYIFNDSATETLYGSQLFITTQVPGGSDVDIGVTAGNDVQAINILGQVTGGTYTVQYDVATPVTVAYNSDAATWGQNLQTALRTVPGLGDVTVSVSVFTNAFVFQVNFVGSASNKNHPLLQIPASTLTGANITFSVNKVAEGGPINFVAHAIDVATTPPTGVTFTPALPTAPILIGNIGPAEGLAVWVRRKTPPGSAALPNDGFSVRLAGFATP